MNAMTRPMLCAALLFNLLTGSKAYAELSEYQVEAVFLFNFAQFVEWPPEAFVEHDSPLVIGVLGADPFGAYLDDMVRGEMINGRAIIIERYRTAAEIKVCHILFVSRHELGALRAVLSSLQGRSILTVSDAEGFASSGGMVRFLNVANKIRMRVNLDSAQAARLTISSKLLRRAEIVGRGED